MSPAILDRQKQLEAFKAKSKQNAKERAERFDRETNSTITQRVLRAIKDHSDKD